MLTIVNAGICRGYSGRDHMLDDAPAENAIGRKARTLAEARRIVKRAAKEGNYTGSPVFVHVRNEFGDLIKG